MISFFKLLLELSVTQFILPTDHEQVTSEETMQKCQMIAFVVTMLVDDEEEGSNPFMQITTLIDEIQANSGTLKLFGELIDWVERRKLTLTEESPIIIALADAMESTYPDFIDPNHISTSLRQAVQEAFIPGRVPLIKRVMCIAYTRKVVR